MSDNKITNEYDKEKFDESLKKGEELIKEENNEKDTIDEFDLDKLNTMLKLSRDSLIMMQDSWNDTKREFKFTDDQMKQLYQFNEQNRDPMPENLTDEEKDKWDHFNGLNKLTYDDIIKVFGEDHPIIGVQDSQTIDRIKDSVEEFFNYLAAMREYKKMLHAYSQAIELSEESKIEELKRISENETNEEKKAIQLKSIDDYYYNKYLGFLKDIDEKLFNRLVDAYGDEKLLDYWIKRSRDKLHTLKINSKFILEISQFEKRYLPEKYHCISNLLLLRFINICTFCNTTDPKDTDRQRIYMMVNALDNIINDVSSDEVKEKVLNNIMEFLDMFIDTLKKKYPEYVK